MCWSVWIRLMLGCVVLVAAGCGDSLLLRPDRQDSQSPEEASPFAVDRAGGDAVDGQIPATRYYLRYDVLRVEVPPGTVSRSEILWNHVDESVLPFEVTRRARMNGLRVGLADREAWPAIKAVLESAGATQVALTGLTQDDFLPFAVKIDPVNRDRTVFHYGAKGVLEGSTYTDSLGMLRIEHALNPERLGEFEIRLLPEARGARLETTLAATESGLREVPVYRGKVFADLAVQMTVPEGTIIVFGPSDRAGRQSLIGTEFLIGERNGVAFERIFFITPFLVPRDAEMSGLGELE